MLKKILKNDLRRKKGINIILFCFIVIATIFLASSISNIIIVQNATDYTLDKGEVPDFWISSINPDKDDPIIDWINKSTDIYDSYSTDESFIIPPEILYYNKGNKDVKYKIDSDIYIQTKPKHAIKAFDVDDKKIDLKKGEIAVINQEATRHNFKLGDKIIFKTNTGNITLTIKNIVKEPLFIGSMAGMLRFLVSDEDYQTLSNIDGITKHTNYYITTKDVAKFKQAFQNQELGGSYLSLEKSTIKLLYSMDLIMAGILTVIGLCLIVIAMFVLRFTIVFTIEEENKEIGIMKAIGMRDLNIKSVYLVKYLALVVVGSTLGCIISFPVGNMMINSVVKNMLIQNSTSNIPISILCSIVIILFVISLCYLSMRRLNKFSVINVIRNADNNSQKHKYSIFKLHKQKFYKFPLYMALNDIFCNIKQFIVLIIVFSIGIVLIIAPLNTLNTMSSTEMSNQFLLDKNATVFIRDIMNTKGEHIKTTADLSKTLDKIQKKFSDKGYDTELNAYPLFQGNVKASKDKNVTQVLMTKSLKNKYNNLTYTEGHAPKLVNEIAISKKVLDELNLGIGDSVRVNITGKPEEMIITGTYQDYMQLGKSARLNPEYDINDTQLYTVWSLSVYGKNVYDTDKWISDIKKDFPEYSFNTAFDVVSLNVGGILDNISSMRLWLVVLISAINILITILMQKMFLIRENGQLAILLSMGFKHRTLRLWQTARMSFLLIIALLFAIPISKLVDATVLKGIFGIMGADITIQPDILQNYIICPAILLVLIIIATAFSTRRIKNIDIREVSDVQ